MKKIYFLLVLLFASSQAFAQYTMVSAYPNLTFTSPIFFTNAGDGSNRVYVVEKGGLIKVFQNDSTVSSASVFLNVTARISTNNTERGLLGLAFHPNYNTNHYFYIFYTKASGNTGDLVIARFTRSISDPLVADSNSQLVEMTIPHSTQGNHNGGNLMFGQDGYLYIGVGDGGSEGDPNHYGQDSTVWLAKVLRIDINNPSGGNNYGIPPGNLFTGGFGGKPETYAWGMRNPWRFSQDPVSGTIYVGDVGQNIWEEVDTLKAGNYGWSIMESFHCYNPPTGCNQSGLILPIKEYQHISSQCSITGGYVYRGTRRPELVGRYIYADYCAGRIWKLRLQGGILVEDSLLTTAPFAISSFGVDQNNELYVCQFTASGKIYRFNQSVTGINGNNSIPEGYSLEQNYPNPFNPVTSIGFSIGKTDFVNLKIYNVLGEEVQTLLNETKTAGSYKVNWDALNFPSGVYFYKLVVGDNTSNGTTGAFTSEKKMVLIK
jgi:glucose/arabinose dehydrogenase